jgi:hypothetical protein
MLGSIFTAITFAAMLNTAETQTIVSDSQSDMNQTKLTQTAKASNTTQSIDDFHTINLNLNVNVIIVEGNETDVIFDGDVQTASLVDINIKEDVLEITAKAGAEEEFYSKIEDKKFTIIVTMKEVKSLVINGSGNIHCHHAVKMNKLNIEINGSGQVHTPSVNISVPTTDPTTAATH